MKLKKSDFILWQEAVEKGMVVCMEGIGFENRKRNPLSDELRNYFRERMPGYNGIFTEDQCEDVLFSINDYMEENQIDKFPLSFPCSNGTNTYLIPITDNIQLRVLTVDEYFGGGEYDMYIDMTYFVINEQTTKNDVDRLIEAVKKMTGC